MEFRGFSCWPSLCSSPRSWRSFASSPGRRGDDGGGRPVLGGRPGGRPGGRLPCGASSALMSHDSTARTRSRAARFLCCHLAEVCLQHAKKHNCIKFCLTKAMLRIAKGPKTGTNKIEHANSFDVKFLTAII